MEKQNLFEVEAERLTLKNFDGIAVTRDHMYEINREAKEKSRKKIGIVKCKIANVIAVASKICGIDLSRRK